MFIFGRQKKQEPHAAINSAGTMADTLSSSLRGLPSGRQTTDPENITGILNWISNDLKGYPTDNRQRIITVFRMLAQSDDDVGGTLRDLKSLGNTAYTWEVDGGSRAEKRALAELERFEGFYRGGVKQFTDNQIFEAYVTGASSVEWVVENGQLSFAEVVPAEEITIKRNSEDVYEYYQEYLVHKEPLNPFTYRYYPLNTEGRSPYGVPAMVTALKTLYRKSNLMDGEDRVISALKKLAFVLAEIEPPSAQSLGVSSENSPEYLAKLKQYTADVANIMKNGADNGLLLTPKGITAKSNNITTNTTGASQIMDSNNRLVWSGLGTLPFMRGKMDSTTQALSEVVYPILLSFTADIMTTVDTQLNYGANLFLRLAGIPATVKIVREESPNPFRKIHAEARKIQLEADKLEIEMYGNQAREYLARARGYDATKLEPMQDNNDNQDDNQDVQE